MERDLFRLVVLDVPAIHNPSPRAPQLFVLILGLGSPKKVGSKSLEMEVLDHHRTTTSKEANQLKRHSVGAIQLVVPKGG